MGERYPLAPELLAYIDDYITEADPERALAEPLDSGANLLVFCRELYAQLFANVIGEPITGIGSAAATRAVVLMRSNGRRWQPELVSLVRMFLHFSKFYPDLIGEMYSESPDEVGNFHVNFVPSLLRALAAWATATRETALAIAVASAIVAYSEFLATLSAPHCD